MGIMFHQSLAAERRDALVLLLAWAAGSVDAIGYFGLEHVFTANMTGNTVLLGLALGQGHVLDVVRNLVALAGFVAGLGIGALMGEGGKAGEWDRKITWIIALEAAALAAFTVAWHVSDLPHGPAALKLLIVLAAFAMGLQSAGMRRLSLPGVATTYVTGTMTFLISGLTTRFHETMRNASLSAAMRELFRWNHQARMQGTVLGMYLFSAVLSGLFQMRLPALVAVTPLVALCVVLIAVMFSKSQPTNRPSTAP